MSRILYFMQVPWDWVKQRPHFLAEGLAPYFDLTVVHNKPYTRRKLVKNPLPAALKLKEFHVFPFAYLSTANALLISRQLRRPVAEADIVWLTHPFQYHQIRSILPADKKVVYDCMDNFLEFRHVSNHPALAERVFRLEEELVRRSDLVLASSHYLREMLLSRYGVSRAPVVVNNAISIDDAWRGGTVGGDGETAGEGGIRKISYIGTVAEWFDFDLILEELGRNEQIACHLYGPAEVEIPAHPRLIYHGPVPHADLLAVMRGADALIMTFRLNDLVLAVNPVKLYEYAYSHKPAIAVRYPESAQFEDLVHLYSTRSEFHALMDQVVSETLRPKRSRQECEAFALSNTWNDRSAQIVPLLRSIAARC